MRIRRIRKLILDIFHEMFEALRLPGVDRLKVDNRDDCPILHKVQIVGTDGKKYWIWAMPDPFETASNLIYEASKISRTDLKAEAAQKLEEVVNTSHNTEV